MTEQQSPIKICDGDPLAVFDGSGSFVVGQLGQSLDGCIATRTGHSKYINHKDGLTHLHRLRAAVDAVVVGVGTVNDDDPALNVRHCEGKSPVRVIIDPQGRVFEKSKMFSDGGTPVTIFCRDDVVHPLSDGNGQGISVTALPHTSGRIAPKTILDALRQQGLNRVLISSIA